MADPTSDTHMPSNYMLRVATLFGQMLLVGSFIFYAGATYQRLNDLEGDLSQHDDAPYHGAVGERITRLEIEVGQLTQATLRLVEKLDEEQSRKLDWLQNRKK
jgi:hypothetical protein